MDTSTDTIMAAAAVVAAVLLVLGLVARVAYDAGRLAQVDKDLSRVRSE